MPTSSATIARSSSPAAPRRSMNRGTSSASTRSAKSAPMSCAPARSSSSSNQYTFRFKSPERLRRELEDIGNATGITKFFGTDDNFFNNRETVAETFTELAKGRALGKPFRDSVFFATEATEFDVYKNQDL